jgi:hypothetical protein
MIVPVVFPCKIRFLESKSWALELITEFVKLDNQRIFFCQSNTTRLPSSDMVRIPEEFLMGLFLLATHLTVGTGI